MEQDQKAADILKVIAHPTRLKILKLLGEVGPLSVSTLQNQLGVEQSLLSHYLIKMRDVGILAAKRQGKSVFYELVNPSINDVINVILSQPSNWD